MIEGELVIDVHYHIPLKSDDEWGSRLVESMDRNGVDKVCISALANWKPLPPFRMCAKGNRTTLLLAERFPERIIPFYYACPPHGARAVNDFEACVRKYGARGLKLWVSCRCNAPRARPLVEKAIELDVPILIHSYFRAGGNMPGESSPNDVRELAQAFPQAKIMMAHVVTEVYEWNIAAVKDMPNVYVDCGGNPPHGEAVDLAVKSVGEDRVLMGSDGPGRGFGNGLGKILGADISRSAKRKALGLNAAKLLKLQENLS